LVWCVYCACAPRIPSTPPWSPCGPPPAPPRSLSPTVTPAGAVCCAASRAGETVSNRAAPIAATLKYRLAFGLIDALLVCLGVTAPAGDVRSGSRADESNADERSRAYPCTVHRRPQRRRARREPPDRFPGHAWGPPSAAARRAERGEGGRRRQQMTSAEIGDYSSHERSPKAIPVAVLHVIELPRGIARGAAGNRWNWAQSAQIRAVANG